MKNTDFAWLAGIIDGEGCITFDAHKKKHTSFWRPLVTITNNNPFLMRRISEMLVEKNIKFYWLLKKRKDKNHKKTLVIRIYGLRSCKKLIDMIEPYIIGKKEQLLLVREYIRLRLERFKKHGSHNPYSEKELEIINRVKSLNHHDYLLQRLPRRANSILGGIEFEGIVRASWKHGD